MALTIPILSEVDTTPIIEQPVVRSQVYDNRNELLQGGLNAIMSAASAYAASSAQADSQKAQSTKMEAMTKAYDVGMKVKDARERGLLTATQAKVALNKAQQGLVSYYGVGLSDKISSSISRSMKFQDYLLKDTEYDKMYQGYLASTGNPASAAARAHEEYDLYTQSKKAEYKKKIRDADPNYQQKQQLAMTMAKIGLDINNPDDVALFRKQHVLSAKVSVEKNKLELMSMQQGHNSPAVQTQVTKTTVVGFKNVLSSLQILQKTYENKGLPPEKAVMEFKAKAGQMLSATRLRIGQQVTEYVARGVISQEDGDKIQKNAMDFLDKVVNPVIDNMYTREQALKTKAGEQKSALSLKQTDALLTLAEKNPKLFKTFSVMGNRGLSMFADKAANAANLPEAQRQVYLQNLNDSLESVSNLVDGGEFSTGLVFKDGADPSQALELLHSMKEESPDRYQEGLRNLASTLESGNFNDKKKIVESLLNSDNSRDLLKESPELRRVAYGMAAQALQMSKDELEDYKGKPILVFKNGSVILKFEKPYANLRDTNDQYRVLDEDSDISKALTLLYKVKTSEDEKLDFVQYFNKEIKPVLFNNKE